MRVIVHNTNFINNILIHYILKKKNLLFDINGFTVLQPANPFDQVAGMVQHYWEHLAKHKRDAVVFRNCSHTSRSLYTFTNFFQASTCECCGHDLVNSLPLFVFQ